ncbi:Uncharacterized protein, UPF0303 family [Consotaella salsifontis]|uniref:UPF0303 protein SAMN05428963_101292 n=2 Tax=Consotaella salsifontis TaxID=1365950 RepID=A0A1T4LN76_9HYPH|nr:heme-degrading domain-containing protein [Consotaella salsifontis]SJZ56165.1 Uncharacterized protein, UPF0303 family [Consotaella salsifontis]
MLDHDQRQSIERDIVLIARQEETLVLPTFDEDVAWALGSRLRRLGAGLPIVIDVRRFGLPLFFTALPGSAPDNVEWVRRKSSLVARFYRASYAVGLDLRLKETTLTSRFGISEADYAAHGGSFPIRTVSSGIVGSLTVSGLRQRDDHALVVRALAEHLDIDPAETALPDQ